MLDPADPASFESALRIATLEVPTAAAADRAGDIRRALIGRRYPPLS